MARKDQQGYIQNLYHKSKNLTWPPYSPRHDSNEKVLPMQLLTTDQTHEWEPDLSPDIVAALFSPETGIVDSHALMQSLEQDISDSESGTLMYSTAVVRVDPYRRPTPPTSVPNSEPPQEGWVVQTVTSTGNNNNTADILDGETASILTRTLINASGLSATQILNSLLPERRRIPMFYARGSYAAYSGPGVSRVSRLIYPCPEPSEKKNLFHSLGTHLTLDLNGQVRFGPDIEWICPSSLSTDAHDAQHSNFWSQYLVPDESRLGEAHRAVTSYLSGVTLEGMRPDFVGIRPKIAGPGAGFQDFVVRVDFPSDFGGDGSRRGRGPMITTLGVESPGLTSSLAIAEYIAEDILAKMD